MNDSSGITGSIVSANGLGCVALKLFVNTLAVEVCLVCLTAILPFLFLTATMDPAVASSACSFHFITKTVYTNTILNGRMAEWQNMKDSSGIKGSITSANGLSCVALKLWTRGANIMLA